MSTIPSEPKAESMAALSAPDWLDVVRRRVTGLNYGTVQITIHAGRVTQVESVERTRFQLPGEAR